MMQIKPRVLAAMLAALSGTLYSGALQALGLGNITLDSALNEPLDARVELVQLGGLGENQLRVRLASEDAFDRAGVALSPFLRHLDLEVNVLSRERGVLHLSSSRPVVEPYLSFLLEARWPSGRLVREYTVLLDPPAFSRAPASESAGTPERPPAAEGDGEDAPPLRGEAPPGTIVTDAADTLWSIARRLRPDRSVSVQQTMLAIQRANESDFLGGNINGLMSGRTLELPGLDEIRAVDPQQAVEEVARQNRRYAGQEAPSADTRRSAPRVAAAAGNAATAGGELSVVAEDGETVARVDGEASMDRGAAAAEQDARRPNQAQAQVEAVRDDADDLAATLTRREQELERTRRENDALASRLRELESQVESMRQVIEVADERFTRLQEELAARDQPTPSPSASRSRAADGNQPEAQTEPPGQGQAMALAAQAETSETSASEAGLADRLAPLLRDSRIVGGLLVALLLLVLGLLLRRGRRDSEADEFAPEERPAGPEAAPGMAGQPGASPAEASEEVMAAAGQRISADETSGSSAPPAIDAPEQPPAVGAADESVFHHDSAMTFEGMEPAADTIGQNMESIEFKLEDVPVQPGDSLPETPSADDMETYEFNLKGGAGTWRTADDRVGDDADEPELEIEFDDLDEGAATGPFAVRDAADGAQSGATQDGEGEDDDLLDLGNLDIDEAFLLADDDEEDDEDSPLTDHDEVAGKLDLAVAYEAMGDLEGAREILDEVIAEGNPEQVGEARRLREVWSGASGSE